MQTGYLVGMRFENGTLLQIDDVINQQLENDMHVYAILSGILAINQIFLLNFSLKSNNASLFKN